MLSYTQDNDDKFPPADQWMEVVKINAPQRPEGDTVYHCPSAPKKPNVYGYAYNRNVAEQSAARVTNPNSKMMVYDSRTLTRNASDAGTSLPPEGRHAEGNNIGFVDGHVRWFRIGNGNGETAAAIPVVTP